MMSRFLVLLVSIGLAACASKKKPDDGLPPEVEVRSDLPQFSEGVKALDQERYAEAARIFDQLLVAKPATEHDLVTTYNSAAAYEGLGHCGKAGERYREVTRSSAGKFRGIEAMAFYRLSLMYECLGQDVKAVTALLDARKRGRHLPTSVMQTEIPARLAAAYARLGNRKKALEFFALANKGLKRLVSEQSGKRQQNTLGQSLFLMGQLNPGQRRAEGDPVTFLQSLSMQQPYLLQAVEVGHPVWSAKAANDLDLAYDNIWKYQLKDPEKQNDFFVRAMQVVREMKRLRLPNAEGAVAAVFNKVEATEARLNAEIARGGGLTKLTPEAEKREGLRREGRLVNPERADTLKKKPATKKR